MRGMIRVTLVLIAFFSRAAITEKHGVSTVIVHSSRGADDKIYNGQIVDEVPSFTYMVAIKSKPPGQKDFSHHCGGGLVSLSIVLTAAHCLASIGCGETPILYKVERFIFIAGSENQARPGANHQMRTAEYFLVDQKFAKNPISVHDSGIAKMAQKFDLTSFVTPVMLPTQSENPDEFRRLVRNTLHNDSNCTFAGWGYFDSTNRSSDVLRWFTMKAVSSQQCATQIGKWVPVYKTFDFWKHDQVCFCKLERHSGPGHGDSGGPIVCQNRIVAVYSNRLGFCGAFQMPISALTWINEIGGGRAAEETPKARKSGVTIVSPNSIAHILVVSAVLSGKIETF